MTQTELFLVLLRAKCSPIKQSHNALQNNEAWQCEVVSKKKPMADLLDKGNYLFHLIVENDKGLMRPHTGEETF